MVIKTKNIGIKNRYFISLLVVFLILILFYVFYLLRQKQTEIQRINKELSTENESLTKEIKQTTETLNETISTINTELDRLKNEDLKKTNEGIRVEIGKLKESFRTAVVAYEQMLDLRERGSKITSQESKFASVLSFLSKDDLASAQKTVNELVVEINKEKARLTALVAVAIPASVPEIKEAPSSGYRRQKVVVGEASFLVDIVSADLNSTRVIVDTASDSTCKNDCPVLPLATYVSRSGAYAGVNGTYFCPESYPSCADKKNSFDTLVMNKNKVYFNSDNNVYSSVPVAIFSGNSGRFIGQSSGWGRDTGVDGVIANRPLLVSGGNVAFGGGGEEKEGARGNRSFLGASGSTVYIGVVRNASVADAAKVLQAMGVRDAINLDNGGSTALWSGGYKVGPGRNLPNVVLFVRK